MPRKVTLPGAAELFRSTTPAESATSGRERHDEKITVYISSRELLRLEQARLELRGQHGVAVDRGRMVREAVALMLDDLAEHGGDSVWVKRLRA